MNGQVKQSVITGDRFLVALPKVDQVPQVWVELLHHILEQRAEGHCWEVGKY